METITYPLDPLTNREEEVLERMMAGLANRQIAAELSVEVDTVRWYTKQIYSKLGVHSRTEAVLRAQEYGLGKEKPPAKKNEEGQPQHNLPSYHTLFTGRTNELQAVVEALQSDQARLQTIVGLGGSGKTRLAVEAALSQLDRFSGGVIFVPLAPIQDVDDLETAVARSLGLYLTTEDNVNDRLVDYFQNKRCLLILDNFEQINGGARWVNDILDATQALYIIVTSRSSLNLSAEWVRHLGGIDFPLHADVEDLLSYSAVKLFADRARHVRSDFSLQNERPHVVEICRLTRGMPLAIELAAAWAKFLPCGQIAQEIRRNIDFLAATLQDIDPRHRSLRAVFDASWNLISEEEKQALQRLSVFRGGFGLAAAEQVAGATPLLLAQLIDKSLLNHHLAGQYEMHELLRQYVADQLSQSPLTALSTRSGKLLAWSKLIQGEFDLAAEVAQDIIMRKSGRDAAEEAFGLALSGVLSGMDGDYERCYQMCTAAMAQMNSVPKAADPVTLFFINLGSAVAGYSMEDFLHSDIHIHQAVELARNLHSPAFLTLCLPVWAVILAQENQHRRAVQLLGLAAARPTVQPTWMDNWPLLRELRLEMEADLGADTYVDLWERGKMLNLHETVDLLLAE